MKLAALTGISREALNDLAKRRVRTFEIRSAHNLVIFSEIKMMDNIFLTDVVPPDLIPGVCGYIATVRGVDIHMQRISIGTPLEFEERETMAGRVQLMLHSQGKVKDVYRVDPYKPIYVDAIEIKVCDAR